MILTTLSKFLNKQTEKNFFYTQKLPTFALEHLSTKRCSHCIQKTTFL